MTTSKVRVSVGMTLNLGNYNFARVAIDIENEVSQTTVIDGVVDLAANHDVIQATYNQAEQELVDKVTQLIGRLEREGFLPDD